MCRKQSAACSSESSVGEQIGGPFVLILFADRYSILLVPYCVLDLGGLQDGQCRQLDLSGLSSVAGDSKLLIAASRASNPIKSGPPVLPVSVGSVARSRHANSC